VKTILVADDDESMLALVRLHLSNAGYKVEVAEDAVVAGKKLLKSAPDLLVIDAEMPYLSGIDFVATLLADSTAPAVPILFITAHENHGDRFEAMGVDYLLKPFSVDALLGKVRGLLTPG